jgi:hypothetical protein
VLEEQLVASRCEVGEARPHRGPPGGTTTKAWPLELDGELASLGDLTAAAEAAAAIVKSKVAFMGVARFSRWRRAFVVHRPVRFAGGPNCKANLSYVKLVNGPYFYSLVPLRGFCCFWIVFTLA